MNRQKNSLLISSEIRIVILLILISIVATFPLYYYRQSRHGKKTEDVVNYVREELAKESNGGAYVIRMEMTSNRNTMVLLCFPDVPYYAEQLIKWEIWHRPYGFFDTYSLFKRGDFSEGVHHYRYPLTKKEEVLISSNVGQVRELLTYGKKGMEVIPVLSEEPFIYILNSSCEYELVFEDGSSLERVKLI